MREFLEVVIADLEKMVALKQSPSDFYLPEEEFSE